MPCTPPGGDGTGDHPAMSSTTAPEPNVATMKMVMSSPTSPLTQKLGVMSALPSDRSWSSSHAPNAPYSALSRALVIAWSIREPRWASLSVASLFRRPLSSPTPGVRVWSTKGWSFSLTTPTVRPVVVSLGLRRVDAGERVGDGTGQEVDDVPFSWLIALPARCAVLSAPLAAGSVAAVSTGGTARASPSLRGDESSDLVGLLRAHAVAGPQHRTQLVRQLPGNRPPHRSGADQPQLLLHLVVAVRRTPTPCVELPLAVGLRLAQPGLGGVRRGAQLFLSGGRCAPTRPSARAWWPRSSAVRWSPRRRASWRAASRWP